MELSEVFLQKPNIGNHRISLEDFSKEKLVNHLASLDEGFEELKKHRDDENLDPEIYFTSYYNKLYDLFLLSEEALAAHIMNNQDIKRIKVLQTDNIKRTGWEDGHYYFEQLNLLYSGYISRDFLGLDEVSLEQQTILELVKNRKLVLSYEKEEIILKNYPSGKTLDYYDAIKAVKTMPSISFFNRYSNSSYYSLIENYPDVAEQLRYGLTDQIIDQDKTKAKEVFLLDFDSMLDSTIESKRKDIKILTRNRKIIKEL